MKKLIGVVHSIYRSSIPSGENQTVREIGKYLELSGFELNSWTLESDLLLNNHFASTLHALKIASPDTRQSQNFAEWISKQSSIQIHNNFPILSFSDHKVLLESKKPIVRVIHNFRKTCLTGNHFREGKPCYKCNAKSTNAGIIRSCYNDSFSKSILSSLYTTKMNSIEQEYITKYVAVSSFVKEYLVAIGIPSEKIHVIENSVPAQMEIHEDASEVLMIGRLEEEKGVKLAIEAWEKSPSLPVLNIVGSGSLQSFVEQKSDELRNIKFWGFLDGLDLQNIVRRCKIAIFPNTWQEPFGRTLAESIARGQAIVATDTGIARRFVIPGKNGFIMQPNSTDLATKVAEAMVLPLDAQISEGRNHWKTQFSPAIAEENWKIFYDDLHRNIV